MYVPVVY